MTTQASIRQIVVPHDFEAAADHALETAVRMAQKMGAHIRVVHVYEEPTYGFPEAMVAAYELAAVIERESREALGRIVERNLASGVPLETELRRGTPWKEIDAVARECKADLIVMGTHGRHGVQRMFLGSVAEKVVRTAPCSVLTVRIPDAVADSPAP